MNNAETHVGTIKEVAINCDTVEKKINHLKTHYGLSEHEYRASDNFVLFYTERFSFINNKTYQIDYINLGVDGDVDIKKTKEGYIFKIKTRNDVINESIEYAIKTHYE